MGKMALIPGFVNAHTHAAMVLLRGLGEDSPLKVWLETKIWPLEARLTREHICGDEAGPPRDGRHGRHCLRGYVLRDGCRGGAALETGVRIAPCRGIVGDGPEKLAEGLALADTWRDHKDFVSVQLGPHAPTPSLLLSEGDMRRWRKTEILVCISIFLKLRMK
ncbi:hypothetical protein MASR2M79_24460 [Aminivibrio sp.]